MRSEIFFIDDNGKPTNDYVQGKPCVWVNIEVGYTLPDNPGEEVLVNTRRLPAFVDTGSNHTMISEEFGAAYTPLRTNRAINVGVVRAGKVFNAFVHIVNLKPWVLEIGCSSLEGAGVDVIIGRDPLSHFGMVYDPPRNQFYLEER